MSKERSALSSWLSASSRGASRAAATPIGTLTKRTHSQPRYSVSTPPRSTPAAPPEPATAPQTPRAPPRAGDGAPDAQRPVALGALGEGVGHDRERRGGDQRGAEALQGARG